MKSLINYTIKHLRASVIASGRLSWYSEGDLCKQYDEGIMKILSNFSFKAAMYSLLAWIPATIYGLSLSYADICQSKTSGACSSVPFAPHVPMIGIVALVIAIMVSLICMAYAAEGITRKENTRMAYSALTLLAVCIIFFLSGLFQMLVLVLI